MTAKSNTAHFLVKRNDRSNWHGYLIASNGDVLALSDEVITKELAKTWCREVCKAVDMAGEGRIIIKEE